MENKEDEKLKNYNAAMLVGTESSSVKRQQIRFSDLNLDEKKWALFKAFVKDDEMFVFKFDDETRLRRKFFLKRNLTLGSQTLLQLLISNVVFAKTLAKSESLTPTVKLAIILPINIAAIAYGAYYSSVEYFKV